NATRKCLLVTVFLVATIQLSARYERFLPGVAIGLLLGCVVIAVLMIGEVISLDRWPPPRLGGFGRGENPILAAILFGIALITALDILRSPDWKRYWRMAAAGAAIPLIAATPLTHSRGPWVALFATLIVLLLAERRWSLLLGVGAATAAGAMMVMAGMVDLGSIVGRADSQRLMLWSQTWEWIVENPILGAGYDADLGLVTDDGRPIKAPHSLYLSVLAYFGLAGAIPFFGMLGYCLRRMVPELTQGICRMSTLLLIFGLVSGALHGYVPLINLNVEWLVLWLPIGYEIGRAQREKSAQTDT
ncbi:MAG: O-antigen ligase family protein, partial [Nitrospirae bacterium]|nr:O-antigen ligase family protein [Nitrospirota bacterium]